MAATIERFWPAEGTKQITIDPGASSPVDVLYDKIEALKPQSDQQRSMQSQALTLAVEVGRTRLLVFENLGASIPVPFLVVLVFWLCIIFASFGLFAPAQCDRHHRPLRLCIVGRRCDISDRRARPVI